MNQCLVEAGILLHLQCTLEFTCRETMTLANAYALDHRSRWGRWICSLLWYQGPTVEP